MIKKLILFVILGASLAVFSSVRAQNPPVYKLDDGQIVIIDKNIVGAKPIADTGYYTATISSLKNNGSGNEKILPVVKYHRNLAVNDTYEPQAYLNLIGGPSYWDTAPDSSSVVVAVIDGGFALNHEDLANRWAVNSGEYGLTETEGLAPNCTSRSLPLDKSCNNIDDDANGYVDDWRGWDFINLDNDPMVGTTNPAADGVDHATVVAGLVAEDSNNSLGAASLNQSSKIMPLQIFSDDGAATSLELAEAITYAVDNGADVINLSLGSVGSDLMVDYLLEQARAAGVITIAAAGNCGGAGYIANGCSYDGQMLYPANSDNVIAVGSTDLSDVYAEFSSRGSVLDLVAPGSGAIITTDYTETNPTDSYTAEVYGTSFSTPIVSGLVASLKANWPEATFADIRSVLVDSAYKPTGMSGNLFTSKYGFGRIDPLAATNLASVCRSTLLDSDYDCNGSVDLLDLSLFASQWQKAYTGRTDSNHSGLVDLLDLSLLASQWGQ